MELVKLGKKGQVSIPRPSAAAGPGGGQLADRRGGRERRHRASAGGGPPNRALHRRADQGVRRRGRDQDAESAAGAGPASSCRSMRVFLDANVLFSACLLRPKPQYAFRAGTLRPLPSSRPPPTRSTRPGATSRGKPPAGLTCLPYWCGLSRSCRTRRSSCASWAELAGLPGEGRADPGGGGRGSSRSPGHRRPPALRAAVRPDAARRAGAHSRGGPRGRPVGGFRDAGSGPSLDNDSLDLAVPVHDHQIGRRAGHQPAAVA